jgi:hypothetical protein
LDAANRSTFKKKDAGQIAQPAREVIAPYVAADGEPRTKSVNGHLGSGSLCVTRSEIELRFTRLEGCEHEQRA